MGLYQDQVNANIEASFPRYCKIISLASVDYENAAAEQGFAIYIPSIMDDGDIKATTLGGDVVTFTDFSLGDFLRDGMRFTKVWKTGTTIGGASLEACY
jgi:hypothetical protein